MKKKALFIFGGISTVLFIALMFVIVNTDQDGKKESDSYGSFADTETSANETVPYSSEEASVETAVGLEQYVISKDGLELQILSCERCDTPEIYDGYQDEFMFYTDFPEMEPDVYYETEIDYDSVYREAPRYRDMEQNPDRYSIDEQIAIMQETERIVEKHTHDVEIHYDFIFLTCRLTNTLEENYEAGINLQTLIQCEGAEWDTRESCYFNKAQKKNTDMNFFMYWMEPGESLEYTIGFRVRESDPYNRFYFGIPDTICDDDGYPQNPIEQTMYVKQITW